MSGRVAGVGMQLPSPSTSRMGPPCPAAPRNFPAKEEQERGLVLPHFLQGLGFAGILVGSERERLPWVGFRPKLLPSGTITSPVAKGLLPSLQRFRKKSLP